MGLNYHHLYYFWVVAREGSIARACEKLKVAQPTISMQLRALEGALGEKLFLRQGRGLALTEVGRTTLGYADEIFSLGRELVDAVRGSDRASGKPLRFVVGVSDVLAKLVAYRLLAPAFELGERLLVTCREDKPERLFAELAVHSVDLVLTDAPLGSDVRVRAYNHLLGECGVMVFGAPELAERYRPGFPRSLDGAPFLLPTENTTLRRALEPWLQGRGIRPRLVGEFEDSATLKVFGQAGLGLFTAPSIIEDEVKRQYRVELVGRLEEVRERFYAISVERRIKHPAVMAISQAARQTIFG